MACGNNHVSRAHMAAPPAPAHDPQRAAQTALREAERLARQIAATYAREATEAERERAQQLRAQERLQEFHATFDPTKTPPGTHMWKVQNEPVVSDYNSKTGKINMYTNKDCMPIYGNIYPHVHYYEFPTQMGAVASMEHGKAGHAGHTSFGPGDSGRIVADQLTILRQAIADPSASPADVDRQVAILRQAVDRSRRP
jgi:hypothetical protein